MTSTASQEATLARPRASLPSRASKNRSPGFWIEVFMYVQISCQLALLWSAVGTARPLFRAASFGFSLALLFFLPGRAKPHPAAKAAIAILIILVIGFFHPLTNSALAGTAEIALNLAILAPLFWVSHLRIDCASLRRVLLIFWGFHVLSSGCGLLQIYYPGRFQPSLSPVISMRGGSYVKSLEIETAAGAHVFRPMGLTDRPGGAASSGFYAVLLGLGFLLTERRPLLRMLSVAGLFMGMVCVYLSQVRVTLVMLGICIIAFYGIVLWRGGRALIVVLTVALPLIVLASLGWAITLGGKSVTGRLNTLVNDRPGNVFYQNRGRLLQYTFETLLPEYPLGAGLGRWGMVYAYFGSSADPRKDQIWSEVQWTGWILDGGIPMILAYLAAIFLAIRTAFRIALLRDRGELWIWGALLVAYNFGALAATFTYDFFIGQGGMELWLLNATLFAAALRSPDNRTRDLRDRLSTVESVR